jgi:hypothetical protein
MDTLEKVSKYLQSTGFECILETDVDGFGTSSVGYRGENFYAELSAYGGEYVIFFEEGDDFSAQPGKLPDDNYIKLANGFRNLVREIEQEQAILKAEAAIA